MGEIADAILNGDYDEESGEWIGPGQGFPRSPQREARERAERKDFFKKNPATGQAAVNGVFNYISNKNTRNKETRSKKEMTIIVTTYYSSIKDDTATLEQMCETIQRDFKKFVAWYKKHY